MDQQLKTARSIDGSSVGPVALGTMRFAERNRSKQELVDLFSYLYQEVGINVHHSSYEYSSYHLYCDALKLFKKKAVST